MKKCELCARFRKTQSNKPVKPNAVSEKVFQKLGKDLMLLNNEIYLVIIDCFSRWIGIEKKNNNKSIGEKIQVFKMVTARFGVPETIVIDNALLIVGNIRNFQKDGESYSRLSINIIFKEKLWQKKGLHSCQLTLPPELLITKMQDIKSSN